MRPARATKKSNPSSSKPTSTASQQGRRDAGGSGVVSKSHYAFNCKINDMLCHDIYHLHMQAPECHLQIEE